MNQTWPYFYPVQQSAVAPSFGLQASAIPSRDPLVIAPMEYSKIEIVYPGAQALVSMSALAQSVLASDLVQTEDALPFLYTDPNTLEDLDEETQMDVGPHTHTLFLHHQVSVATSKELAPFLQADEAMPVMVVLTYVDPNKEILQSYYMGNIVQYAGHRYVPGTAVIQTTALQCFLVSEFQQPLSPDLLTTMDLLMTQARIHELAYEDEDYEADESDDDSDE
jgi:hypothetical protein